MQTRSPRGISALLSLPGVGAQTAVLLAEAFDTVDEIADASPGELARVSRRAEHVNVEQAIALPPEALEGAVCLWDNNYPVALKAIADPPPLLWIRGTLRGLGGAVVGTREPTEFGRRASVAAARCLVEAGASVISGLALGIDGEAHRAALSQGGHTVAVLGSGVDTPTPSGHRDLAAQILESGGGLVSEQPPGTRPVARMLVARNRLQTGLSRLTVVAQCGIPSGTLHTARFALQQARRLIVPCPVGQHREHSELAGNVALTSSPPDPTVVNATGPLAETLKGRRMLADDAPVDADQLAVAIQAALRRDAASPHEAIQPSLL